MKDSVATKMKQVTVTYLVVIVDPHKKKHPAAAVARDFANRVGGATHLAVTAHDDRPTTAPGGNAGGVANRHFGWPGRSQGRQSSDPY